MMKQLLPMLAPLVLNWLANRQKGDGLDAVASAECWAVK